MRIDAVAARPLQITFKPAFRHASAERSSTQAIFVSIRYLGNDRKFAKRVYREEIREARREDRRQHRERVAAQGAIDLYGRPNFRGRSLRVEESAPDLWEQRFDGRASSAIVREGTWQLCSQPGYSGSCLVVGPGEYPRLAGLDDRVSSIGQVY